MTGLAKTFVRQLDGTLAAIETQAPALLGTVGGVLDLQLQLKV